MCLKLSDIRYRQFLISAGAMLTMGAANAHVSWTSPALPIFDTDESPIGRPLTTTEISLITALPFMGMLFGSAIASWVIENLGRKKCLLFSTVPLLASSVLIFFGKSVPVIYIARITLGIGLGLAITGCPVYGSEISDNDIRGKVSLIIATMTVAGSLCVYSIGPFVSYQALTGVTFTISLCAAIACLLIPESPFYLIKRNQSEEARKVLKTLSHDSATKEYIEKRYLEIQMFVEEDSKQKTFNVDLFFKKEHRKSLIIGVSLVTFVYLSGMTAIEGNMESILDSSGSTISSKRSSIIFGITQILSSLPAGTLADKLGRKPLLIVSSFLCGLANFSEGMYFFLKEKTSNDMSAVTWLPITSLLVFEACLNLGPASLPFVVGGEIFALHVKGFALGALTIFGSVLAFAIQITFEPIVKYCGTYTAFWFYGGCCFVETIFAVFVLPETKGKSLAEIQHSLRKNNQT